MPDDERSKLTAAWLNIIAAGVISTGGFVQITALLSGDRPGRMGVAAVAIALLCIGIGTTIHLVARAMVGPSRGTAEDPEKRDRPRPRDSGAA